MAEYQSRFMQTDWDQFANDPAVMNLRAAYLQIVSRMGNPEGMSDLQRDAFFAEFERIQPLGMAFVELCHEMPPEEFQRGVESWLEAYRETALDGVESWLEAYRETALDPAQPASPGSAQPAQPAAGQPPAPKPRRYTEQNFATRPTSTQSMFVSWLLVEPFVFEGSPRGELANALRLAACETDPQIEAAFQRWEQQHAQWERLRTEHEALLAGALEPDFVPNSMEREILEDLHEKASNAKSSLGVLDTLLDHFEKTGLGNIPPHVYLETIMRAVKRSPVLDERFLAQLAEQSSAYAQSPAYQRIRADIDARQRHEQSGNVPAEPVPAAPESQPGVSTTRKWLAFGAGTAGIVAAAASANGKDADGNKRGIRVREVVCAVLGVGAGVALLLWKVNKAAQGNDGPSLG